ncbi:MAG: hypothetical protein HY901_04395 [Deltaproteobacteria bacterium]|nr:hypothetical protein [Deltaproteobacteria bacterium]
MSTRATTIAVQFVDEATGIVFARSSIPSESLPGTFEADTTVSIAGEEWQVCSSTPGSRAEYEERGTLSLVLRRIEVREIAPGDILFSLPTVASRLPPIAEGTSKLGKRVLELHEDDWCQLEVVASAQRAAIETELAAIRRIYEEAGAPAGFKRTHLRRGLALLEARLPLAALRAQLPSAVDLDGVGFQGVSGLVAGGFAFEVSPELALYGTAKEGIVEHLGVVGSASEAAILAPTMAEYALVLVDWIRVKMLPG